jgi:hypothetical protein
MAEPGKKLGEHPAEVIVIIVEHHYAPRRGTGTLHRMITGQQVIGGEHDGFIGDRDRAAVPAPDAVAPPAGAGRDQDVGKSEAEGVIRRDLISPADRHGIAVMPLQLPDPVLRDTAPGGQAGERRLADYPAAELAAGLGQHHRIAALAERAGGFQAGRPGADDQHAGIGGPRPDPLRMPSPAPLLAHSRVLRAADRRHGHVTGNTDIAPDALAYVVELPRLDLGRQERVRNRRPGRADHVQDAGPHLAHHGVRRREPAYPHHRLRRHPLQARDQRLAFGLGREARRGRVQFPAAEDEVPYVGQMIEQRDDLRRFGRRDPGIADSLIDGQAARDGRAARAFLAGVLEDLGQQARPVGDRAAVAVCALVVPARQEVMQDAQVVPAVDVDDVVTRGQGTTDRKAMPAAQVTDVRRRHHAGLNRVV